jgi:hypothetical protein
MGGGITQLPMNQMMVPRGEYGLGSIVKSVKKAVKGAAGAVKDFASSDVGKMALMAAGAYYAPAMFGGTVGFGPASTYGSFARGLMSPNLIGPMTKAGSLGRTISSAVTGGGVSGLLTGKSGMALSAIGGGLLGSIFGSPEKAAEMYAQNPEKVQSYLAQYYKNINQDATEEEVQQFVSSQTSGLAAGQYGSFATGGRVGYADGSYKFMELIDKDAEEEYYTKRAEELDRKYNPQNYNDIIPKEKPMDKYMLNEIMGDKGMNTLSEDTRDMAMKMYAEKAYKKGQISKKEYNEIMGRDMKAVGGMPMGEPRKNQGGIMELDYRKEGGFVPIGIKEKADDVPAMLSKNEFVFTADAVRGAGEGNVEKGAERLYNTMKTLENGGTV